MAGKVNKISGGVVRIASAFGEFFAVVAGTLLYSMGILVLSETFYQAGVEVDTAALDIISWALMVPVALVVGYYTARCLPIIWEIDNERQLRRRLPLATVTFWTVGVVVFDAIVGLS